MKPKTPIGALASHLALETKRVKHNLIWETVRRLGTGTMGPTFFDSFPYHIYERDSEGKLRRFPFESEWEKVFYPLERRKALVQNRRVPDEARDGLFRLGVQLGLREDRRKGGPNRRDPLRCEVCNRVFPNFVALCDHLPCRANEKMVRLGFLTLIGASQRRGVISSQEVNQLRKIVLASLSEDAFNEACKDGSFRWRSQLSKEQNYERYRSEWLLCLLAYIRRDEINQERVSAEMMSVKDREDLMRIQREFLRSRPTTEQEIEQQERILREFFDRSRRWQEITKPGVGRPPIQLSPREEKAFQDSLHLRGRKLAIALERAGVKGALDRYNESPHDFSEWVRPRKEIAKRHLAHGITSSTI